LGPVGRILVGPHLARAKVAAAINDEFGKRAWEELWEGIPHDLAGTWLGVLVSTRGDAGLHGLARGLARRWRFFHPELRQALMERADSSKRTPAEEKVELIQIGLLLALQAMKKPQMVRIGKKWIVDEEGRKTLVAPHHLRADLAVSWFSDKAIAEATSILVDERGLRKHPEEPDTIPFEESIHLTTVIGPDSLATMVDTADAATKELRALLESVTPRQREILEALHFSLGSGATFPEAKAEAADALTIGVDAIEMALSRIRHRTRPPK
jgi:hypothetical protein